MENILNYTRTRLMDWLVDHGEKPFKAQQLFAWLYKHRELEFGNMSNLSKATQAKLGESFEVGALALENKQVSSDGTIKYLFRTQDGLFLETVLMSQDYGYSICVTSQLGCNMGCTFCASGILKKQRDLSCGEIVAQLLQAQRDLDGEEKRISHIVVMGIGEPFDNYDNVMDFINIANDDHGFGIGARHITISTCGVVPSIKRFADEQSQVNLAISLHAPNDELRSQLMPINNRYPLKSLMDSLRYYLSKNNRRLTFEYILIENVNDSIEQANELADLIRDLNAYVNLIPYNPVDEKGYKQSSKSSQLAFYDRLKRRKIQCTLRREQGQDIDAACGQLRAKKMKGLDYAS
ncbi:MAG: 23S rRNA (adenine(2503)-C(2))-methyltransferase RlmN [Erysipelothrix sp.]|nr:23S rRNA (adenine(2503)-C(2))-methyltransferase RlmN [Erysipelothrix sp.]